MNNIENLERDLAIEYEKIGFIRSNNEHSKVWLFIDKNDPSINFYLGHSIKHGKLEIRLVSHGINPELTKEIGSRVKELLNSKYPDIYYEYKYFEQTSPFTYRANKNLHATQKSLHKNKKEDLNYYISSTLLELALDGNDDVPAKVIDLKENKQYKVAGSGPNIHGIWPCMH